MVTKRPPRLKAVAADIPDALNDLLIPDDVAETLNAQFSQAKVMQDIIAFLADVDKKGVDCLQIMHNSGFKILAGHFKRLVEDSRNAVREIERAKVLGKLVFTPATAPAPPSPQSETLQ